MTDHPNLAAALAAVQANMPTVHKGNRATVPTKAGGSYSYTYADLSDVSAAALPLLSANGLAFTCCPRLGEKGWELAGKLLHTSGESIEGSLPLTGGTPQEWGSSITYMRRYLLGAMTGLVTDDDDDGNTAQRGAKARQRAPKAPQEPRTPPLWRQALDRAIEVNKGDEEAAKADLARYATDHGHTTKDAPPSLWQNYLDGVL